MSFFIFFFFILFVLKFFENFLYILFEISQEFHTLCFDYIIPLSPPRSIPNPYLTQLCVLNVFCLFVFNSLVLSMFSWVCDHPLKCAKSTQGHTLKKCAPSPLLAFVNFQ